MRPERFLVWRIVSDSLKKRTGQSEDCPALIFNNTIADYLFLGWHFAQVVGAAFVLFFLLKAL